MGLERAPTWEEQYLAALEEERRKIQLFSKELPLCLDLVVRTIESYRRFLGRGEEEERREVELVEFVPVEEEKEKSYAEDCSGGGSAADDELIKSDWLRSAQLWHHQNHQQTDQLKDLARDVGSAAGGGGGESPAARSRRKARRCWLPELHHSFVRALEQLGGSEAATPKQIRELMNIDGLTNDEVKSHLQKYRLHTKRPRSPAAAAAAESSDTSSGNKQPPHFMFGVWMPPAEYAAIAAAAMAAIPTTEQKRRQKKQRFADVRQMEADFFRL